MADTDHIRLAERLVKGAENDGERTVELPTRLARIILELAKTGKLPRGRTPLFGRERVQQSVIIGRARRRKAALMAESLSAEDAVEQAAEEARRAFLPARALSVETIKRMMKNPRFIAPVL